MTGSVFFFVGYLTPKGAGVFIDSNPSSDIFINGEKVGRTPFRQTRRPGTIIVKLVPDSSFVQLPSSEEKITLVSGIETIVRKTFSSNPDFESSEILSFEKTNDSTSSLSVVTSPDSAHIILDGTIQALTPYKISTLLPSDHNLELSLPGFVSRKLDIKTYEGYKLTILLKLAKDSTVISTPTPIPQEQAQIVSKGFVKILRTPVGFLRVRSEPSTLGAEVGQVLPDKEYAVVNTDEKTGWYQILFEDEKKGWVSNQYVQKVDEGSSIKSKLLITPLPTKE